MFCFQFRHAYIVVSEGVYKYHLGSKVFITFIRVRKIASGFTIFLSNCVSDRQTRVASMQLVVNKTEQGQKDVFKV